MESVQKELGLTAEQKQKLEDVAKKAVDAMRVEPKSDWTKYNAMKPEEQRKFQKEMADRYAKRTAETKKQIEQILTAKQIEQVKEFEFRQRAFGMLYSLQLVQQIGLTN
jgi:hypothetical protein